MINIDRCKQRQHKQLHRTRMRRLNSKKAPNTNEEKTSTSKIEKVSQPKQSSAEIA